MFRRRLARRRLPKIERIKRKYSPFVITQQAKNYTQNNNYGSQNVVACMASTLLHTLAVAVAALFTRLGNFFSACLMACSLITHAVW